MADHKARGTIFSTFKLRCLIIFLAGIKITQALIQEKLLQANGYKELQRVTVHQRQLQLAQLTGPRI